MRIVNVLSGTSTSIGLSKSMMGIIGNYPQKIYKPLPESDPIKSIGTFHKMEKFLNISQNEITDLDSGLQETINYMMKEKK